VLVGVSVGVGIGVSVGISVGVAVKVGVGRAVSVAVGVGVEVGVSVAGGVTVAVGVWVGVGVTVGVAVGGSGVGVSVSEGIAGTLVERTIAPVGEGMITVLGLSSDWFEGVATLGDRGVLVGVGVYAAWPNKRQPFKRKARPIIPATEKRIQTRELTFAGLIGSLQVRITRCGSVSKGQHLNYTMTFGVKGYKMARK